MEKELKEYLRHYRNMSEDDIARIEETATEDQLEVLRKGMQFEVTASASVEQIRREQEETQKKAQQRALRRTREERARKKTQFALGLGIIPAVMLVVMLLSSVSNWVEELTTPADMSTAFRSAETYLQMGVSGRQLVEQMILEGCTTEEAEYILENCDADWMEQAVIAARGFREYRDMSDEELLDLLIFQGFSKEEAAYGVKNSK